MQAEYGRQLKVPVVPVIVEEGFRASGWLGILLGQKMYYEYARVNDLQTPFKSIMREIRMITGKEPLNKEEALQSEGLDLPDTNLREFLGRLGYQKYMPIFEDQEVDMEVIIGCNKKILIFFPLPYNSSRSSFSFFPFPKSLHSVKKLLHHFEARELVAMGLKWGHAKKLILAVADETHG